MSSTSRNRSSRTGPPVDQLLLQAALLLIVTILAAGIYLVYYAISHEGMPSSYGDKVIQDARGAYLAAPQDSSAAVAYARALTADGQLAKSSQVLAEFRTVEATSPVPLVTVEEARIEWKRDDPDAALALLDTADAECEELRGFREASYRKKGVQIDPAMPEVIEASLLRADIQEELGLTSEAVEALTRALSEDPTMADVLARRADLYISLGDTSAARADYERALQMIPDYQPALDGLESLDG